MQEDGENLDSRRDMPSVEQVQDLLPAGDYKCNDFTKRLNVYVLFLRAIVLSGVYLWSVFSFCLRLNTYGK